MPKPQLIAIGDIHGCLTDLQMLLELLDPTEDDHLVFLGDYIDRGPDSKGVLEFLLLYPSHPKAPRCTFLRGNHDQMILDAFTGSLDAWDLWMTNGGKATVHSYERSDTKNVPIAHLDFLERTELFYETDNFFFVHAGLDPRLTIEQNKLLPDRENVFLWRRDHHDDLSEPAWEKTVVCGHTIQDEPVNTEKLICIDTGCFLKYWTSPKSGYLTAVILPEREFVTTRQAQNTATQQ